jgi:hypothetical protein
MPRRTLKRTGPNAVKQQQAAITVWRSNQELLINISASFRVARLPLVVTQYAVGLLHPPSSPCTPKHLALGKCKDSRSQDTFLDDPSSVVESTLLDNFGQTIFGTPEVHDSFTGQQR